MSNNMADRKPVAGIINLSAPWKGEERGRLREYWNELLKLPMLQEKKTPL